MSRFISLVLRHRPELIDLHLDPNGWVPVEDLLAGADAAGVPLTREAIDAIREQSDKQRLELNGDRIRARYGHSVGVRVELTPETPPERLYHGTAERFVAAILKDGLNRRQRHHVFLSPDTKTALAVGQRHGRPILLTVDAARMHADGYAFFRPERGIWVVCDVPPRYIAMLPEGREYEHQ